jgi:hypothetical protein
MSTKILLASLVLIILIAVAVVMLIPKPKPKVVVTSEEGYMLEDQLLKAMDEELANVSAEQTVFNEAVENDIASDTSIFYYE